MCSHVVVYYVATMCVCVCVVKSYRWGKSKDSSVKKKYMEVSFFTTTYIHCSANGTYNTDNGHQPHHIRQECMHTILYHTLTHMHNKKYMYTCNVGAI